MTLAAGGYSGSGLLIGDLQLHADHAVVHGVVKADTVASTS
jgi:hypothetical protein